MAQLTANGYGVTRNIKYAVSLLEKAAAQPPTLKKFGDIPNSGVAEAQHSIGLYYADGVGFDKDPVMAAHWYEKASKNGSKEAAHNLGLLYLQGRGVRKDLVKAEQYLNLASHKGNSSAMVDLACLYLERFDFDGANRMYSRAINAGSTLAVMQEVAFQKVLAEKRDFFDSLDIRDRYGGDLTNMEKCERFFNESSKGELHLKDFKEVFNFPDKQSTYLEPATYSIEQKIEILAELSDNSQYAARMLQALMHFVTAKWAFPKDRFQWATELARSYKLEQMSVSAFSPMKHSFGILEVA